MPLLQRVGVIFIEAGEREAFSNSLERFHVEDIGTTDQQELSVVLLVESPHTDEVCHGYPLAGSGQMSAGLIVRNKLVECGPELALPAGSVGRLVHDENPAFLRLGIMNVSRLPLQGDAYDCTPWGENDCRDHPEWNNYITHMNAIRRPAGYRQDPNRQLLDDAIAEDLRERLECLHRNNPDVLLVRCGGVAQSFYDKTGVDMPYCDLPHPTNRGRGGELFWNLNCHDPRLQNIVGRLWPPQQPAQPGT